MISLNVFSVISDTYPRAHSTNISIAFYNAGSATSLRLHGELDLFRIFGILAVRWVSYHCEEIEIMSKE